MNKKLHCKVFCKKIFCALIVLFTVINSAGANLLDVINQQRVTINMQNKQVKDLLKEIRKQTGLNFAYDEAELPSSLVKSINVNNETVNNTLNLLFDKSDYTYEIRGNSILVLKKSVPQAQSNEKINIKGRVLDGNKQPIVGATIIVLGTKTGAITDDKGSFTITLNAGQKIDISCVGYVQKNVTATTSDSNFIVTLESDVLNVEDVVVTGIFERRAGSFTGSATTLKAEDLKRVGNTNVFASLRNLDPSLMIFDNLEFGSDPNKNPKMTLRGTTSIDMSTQDLDIKGTYGSDPNAPLFILDGFEASVQKIMDLDMDRVESLTILKDASAKAIYGSKAANGVIVIETKRSKDGKLRVIYNANVDFQVPDLTSYNLTNAVEKLELEREAGLYDIKDATRYSASSWAGLQKSYNTRLTAIVSGVDTDWLAKPLRMGVGTKHAIGIELGDSRSLRTLIDFSYNNIAGVMKGSNRVTYTGSASFDFIYKNFKFQDKLTVTSNIGTDSPYGTFSEYALMNPYLSPYDINGLLSRNALASIGEDAEEFVENPLYNSQLNTKLQNRYLDVTNNLYVEWTIIQGLKATARFGITEKRNSSDEFYPSNHLKFNNYTNEDFFRKGSFQQNVGTQKILSGDININYSKQLSEKHYIFFNVGFKLEETTFEEIVHKTEGFPNDRMNDIIFARQYMKDVKPTGREQTIRDIGSPIAFNYSYDNRILFDASYRLSASSQFGANNRYGQFWSLGFGWNIHNEDFIKNKKLFNNLKLRGSVGYTGAQSAEAYAAMATYLYFMDRTYRGALGAYLKGMRNDDLKWQQSLEYNIGLDVNLNRRISLTIDAYHGITENNLLPFTLPGTTGFSTVTENLGKVKNTGIEGRANFIIWQSTKDRSYFSINLGASHTKNVVTELSEALKNYNKQQAEAAGSRFSTGRLVQYYDGVSSNANWAVPSLGIDPANGREIYLSKKGTPTYSWNANDAVVFGDKLPKINGTIGVNFEYKGIGMNLSFLYTYGATLYNETLLNKVENADIKRNVDKRLYDGVWRKPGDVKPYKALSDVWIGEEGIYRRETTRETSRFIQDRNELSLSNASLSYDFYRHSFVKKLNMERLKVSVYMNNVFVLSSIDVERGTSYPFARGVNFSLNATF